MELSLQKDGVKEYSGITIMSGANVQLLSLHDGEKLTVGDVRKTLADVLSIETSALAVIGDSMVEDDRVIKPGETLQFVKPSGTKG